MGSSDVGLCRRMRKLGVIAAAMALVAAAQAQDRTARVPGCGALNEGYGPWDYRKDRGEPLGLVESAHFTPEVETLIRGKSSYSPGPDIDYTLRAFPNHHRALLAAVRLGEKEKKSPPPGMRYSLDCWFRRAVIWQPDDHVARMLYANWLAGTGQKDQALFQLKTVENTVAPDNAITRFNLGLVYLDLREYASALKLAHQVAELGYTRSELRDKLTAAGQWSDPPAAAASAAPSSASAPASSPRQ